MKVLSRKKRGFTLIELLVVISIIAVLMSIMMPALGKVRQIAKQTTCVSNIRQLGLAWVLYSEDNRGRIVNGCTKDKDDEPAWVTYGEDVADGALYPYVNDRDVYCCAADKKTNDRSYSLFDAMNGFAGIPGTQGMIVKSIHQIKRTSERGVFIDEGANVDGVATYDTWSIHYNTPSWWDNPPVQHENGVSLAYADGHAAYMKWKDKETIKLGKDTLEGRVGQYNQPDNEDLPVIQRIAWGKLGYKSAIK